jgi:hypothetical protein
MLVRYAAGNAALIKWRRFKTAVALSEAPRDGTRRGKSQHVCPGPYPPRNV